MKKRFILNRKGISVIEVLVAAGVFAVLGILATRAILISLKGAKKSEAQLKVRDNLNYALGVMERQIRNAKSVACSADTTQLTYTNDDGAGVFTYESGQSKITWQRPVEATASDLTSAEISVTGDADGDIFFCDLNKIPPSVDIYLTGRDPNAAADDENAVVTVSTKIFLRTY